MKDVIDLYAHVFLFLNDTMDWYLKKGRQRLRDSFNERFFDHFQDEIENISRKSEVIKRKATQSSAAEVRVIRLELEELRRDIRIGLTGSYRQDAEDKHQRQALETQDKKERLGWQEELVHMVNLHQNLVTFLMGRVQSQKLDCKC